MKTCYILLQSLFNAIHPRTVNAWKRLSQGNYANLSYLLGTAFCLVIMALLIPADLSFLALSLASHWGAQPDKLNEQVQQAKVALENHTGGLFSGIDYMLNWASSNIAAEPTAHMLSGNALATVLIFALVFLFIKETVWPHKLLPLHAPSKYHSIGLVTVCAIVVGCIGFYYSYILYSGEWEKNHVQAEQISGQLFDDPNTTNTPEQAGTAVVPAEREGRYYAVVCYGAAMILATALATWGSMLFFVVAGTFVCMGILLVLYGITYLIEIPLTILGVKIGAMQLTMNNSAGGTATIEAAQPDNTENAPGTEQSAENETSGSVPEESPEENSHVVAAEEWEQQEEERSQIINQNPLGI